MLKVGLHIDFSKERLIVLFELKRREGCLPSSPT